VRDLNFPIDVVVCPIIREADGLAMSSRNTYLSLQERQAALVLSRALAAAREAFQSGEHSSARLQEVMTAVISKEPLARIQYAVCVNAETLQNLPEIKDRALLLLAVFIGKTRLIDNMVLSV
jgi:pantoate--beta-alanine ligase